MPESRAAVVPLHTATLPSGRSVEVRLHASITPGEQPGTVDTATALGLQLLLGRPDKGSGSRASSHTVGVWLDPADAPEFLDALHAALLAMPLPLTGPGSPESLPSEPIGPQAGSLKGTPPPTEPMNTGDPQIDAAWDLVDEQNRLDYAASQRTAGAVHLMSEDLLDACETAASVDGLHVTPVRQDVTCTACLALPTTTPTS